jgi:hypothetical protein
MPPILFEPLLLWPSAPTDEKLAPFVPALRVAFKPPVGGNCYYWLFLTPEPILVCFEFVRELPLVSKFY